MFIINYFDRAIGNKKILVYEDFAYEAKDAFKRLPLYANDTTSITQLSDWIGKYISSEKWESCKTAIRQDRLMKKKRYEYKTYRIPRSLSYDIKHYASITGLTKFAAMQQAIDVAMKALDANEHKVIGHENKKWWEQITKK